MKSAPFESLGAQSAPGPKGPVGGAAPSIDRGFANALSSRAFEIPRVASACGVSQRRKSKATPSLLGHRGARAPAFGVREFLERHSFVTQLRRLAHAFGGVRCGGVQTCSRPEFS